jgi:hypothetical protein
VVILIRIGEVLQSWKTATISPPDEGLRYA